MNVCPCRRGSRAAVFVALVLLATSVGCSRAKPKEISSRSLSDGLSLTYSAGSIIDGEHVDHDFEVTNRLLEPIFIEDDDEDIEKTCGCARLETATRRLEPGGSTTIYMSVNTIGKHGRFRVGGTIRWHTSSGQSWPVELCVEGTTKPILMAKPGLLQFSAEEISASQSKNSRS